MPEEIRLVNTIPDPQPVAQEPELEPVDNIRTFEFTVDNPEPEKQPELAETLVHEFQITDQVNEPEPVANYPLKPDNPVVKHTDPAEPGDFQNKKTVERISKLRALSEKLKNHTPIENNLYEIESIPAYKRRNIELNEATPSSESQVAKFMVSENPDKSVELRSENSFLHKNVD
jgi:cell division protein FtsZ